MCRADLMLKNFHFSMTAAAVDVERAALSFSTREELCSDLHVTHTVKSVSIYQGGFIMRGKHKTCIER